VRKANPKTGLNGPSGYRWHKITTRYKILLHRAVHINRTKPTGSSDPRQSFGQLGLLMHDFRREQTSSVETKKPINYKFDLTVVNNVLFLQQINTITSWDLHVFVLNLLNYAMQVDWTIAHHVCLLPSGACDITEMIAAFAIHHDTSWECLQCIQLTKKNCTYRNLSLDNFNSIWSIFATPQK